MLGAILHSKSIGCSWNLKTVAQKREMGEYLMTIKEYEV